MMDPNQAAADIEDALGLIKGAREDVESIESDAINWGDSSGTVEDAASAARDALDRLISALASALDQLPGDD